MKTSQELAAIVCLLLVCSSISCERAEPGDQERSAAGGPASRNTTQETTVTQLRGGARLTLVERKSECGEVLRRSTALARGEETILHTMWFNRKEAHHRNWPALVRSYFHEGTLILSETYMNNDGNSDMLVLYDDTGVPLQGFDIKNDGILIPWSQERMEEEMKDYELLSEIVTPVFEGVKQGVSEKEFRGLLEDAVERIREEE